MAAPLKIAVLFFGLFFVFLTPGGFGEVPAANKPLACGTETVVLFEKAISADGRYAVGWTIHPKARDAKPVDWSAWDHEDHSKFYEAYVWDADESAKEPYELLDCVVDLVDKKVLPLVSTAPYYPTKNHAAMEVRWSGNFNGNRYALLRIDARFGTNELWLVTLTSAGMNATALDTPIDQAVHRVIDQKRPLNADRFAVSYFPTDEVSVTFSATSVQFAFFAEVPKSSEDNQVEGWVRLELPTGKVLKVWSDTPVEDPFKDDRALKAVDQELNELYAALLRKLSPAQREVLKKEQREWILERNDQAEDANRDAQNSDHAHPERHQERNNALRQATQKRVLVLKAQLR